MDQIAQADAVNGTVGDRRGRFTQVAAHILVHVDRMIGELVKAGVARPDLRVGCHQDRIARSCLPAGLKRKIGLDLGRALRNALPELRKAILHRNFVFSRNGQLHEAALREIAGKRIVSALVSEGRQHSVAHDHAFDGQPALIDDLSRDGSIAAPRFGIARSIFTAAGRQQQPADQNRKNNFSYHSHRFVNGGG